MERLLTDLERRRRAIVQYPHFEPAELFSLAYLIAWALVLSQRGSTFATSPALYWPMRQIGSEGAWTLFILLTLSVDGVALYSRHVLPRYAMMVALTGLWAFFAAMFFYGNHLGVLWALHLVASASAVWAAIKISSRHHDELKGTLRRLRKRG